MAKRQLDQLRTSIDEIRKQEAARAELAKREQFDFAAYRTEYEAALKTLGREKLHELVMENAKAARAEWPEDRKTYTKQ